MITKINGIEFISHIWFIEQPSLCNWLQSFHSSVTESNFDSVNQFLLGLKAS